MPQLTFFQIKKCSLIEGKIAKNCYAGIVNAFAISEMEIDCDLGFTFSFAFVNMKRQYCEEI